jgi:hypothetical protein
MTGADVKAIGNALSDATGRRVSQYDLGVMLGLSVDNAARLVRKWEEEEPSGPAAIALRYLCQGLPGYRGGLERMVISARIPRRSCEGPAGPAPSVVASLRRSS